MWIPSEPGAYQLVARFYSGEKVTASRGTLILIDPLEAAGDVIEDVPVNAGGPSVLPAVQSGAVGGGAPTVGPPTGEAEEWAPMPGKWVSSLISSEAPTAPTIQAEVDGCQVSLWIQDQSENEGGFLVRRQPVAAQAVMELESLAAMPGTSSFEFSHQLEAGSHSYSVRAFHAVGTGRQSYFEWLDEESAFNMGGLFDWPNGKRQVRIELNGLNAPPAALPE